MTDVFPVTPGNRLLDETLCSSFLSSPSLGKVCSNLCCAPDLTSCGLRPDFKASSKGEACEFPYGRCIKLELHWHNAVIIWWGLQHVMLCFIWPAMEANAKNSRRSLPLLFHLLSPYGPLGITFAWVHVFCVASSCRCAQWGPLCYPLAPNYCQVITFID